jgi:pimeloyl-ACP methyl ester carboxylesterase
MEQLVEKGITVIILKVSANLAILETSKALSIPEAFPEILSWYVGGHSLGGIAALAAINNEPELFEGLVLMGSFPSEAFAIQDWDRQVLSLYGEHDALATIEDIEANKVFLPTAMDIDDLNDFEDLQVNSSVTIYYMIEGGNHAQFGAYGPQEGDGTATISTAEQHNEVSTAITNFITWNESR